MALVVEVKDKMMWAVIETAASSIKVDPPWLYLSGENICKTTNPALAADGWQVQVTRGEILNFECFSSTSMSKLEL